MKPTLADLYAILGLAPHATQEQLSHAYRVLLRRHHPDTRTVKNGQPTVAADAALQELMTAYEVLRDPDRRADYDRLRAVTARRDAEKDIRVHRRRGTTIDSPIRVGPVHWHRRSEP